MKNPINKINEFMNTISSIEDFSVLEEKTTEFLKSLEKPSDKPDENPIILDLELLEDIQNLYRTHPTNDKKEGHPGIMNALNGITML